VLADLERFAEADAVYRQALHSYDDISPFPLAWGCFQLGMLWGELVPVPDPNLAALWYRRAVAYLPGYVRARVHLAEICVSQDRTGESHLPGARQARKRRLPYCAGAIDPRRKLRVPTQDRGLRKGTRRPRSGRGFARTG
jgi:hypothetical protein